MSLINHPTYQSHFVLLAEVRLNIHDLIAKKPSGVFTFKFLIVHSYEDMYTTDTYCLIVDT